MHEATGESDSIRRPADQKAVVECYQRRRAAFEAEARRWRSRASAVSWYRVGSFVGAAGSFATAAFADKSHHVYAGLTLSVAFALAFVALVIYHQRVRRAARDADLYAELNAAGAARIERRWRDLPAPSPLPRDLANSPVARDLDVFGRASLFQLLSTATTAIGRHRLARWLSHAATPRTVSDRQEAVRELAPMLASRQTLAHLGLRDNATTASPQAFLDWAETPPGLSTRAWFHVLRWAIPSAFLLLATFGWLGVVPAYSCLLVPMVGLLISVPLIGPIHATFAQISRRQGEIATYVAMLRHLASLSLETPEARRLQQLLRVESLPAHRCLDRLRRWMDAADLRFSQVYLPVQILTMWDLHILAAVESWQRRYGPQVHRWFEALADFEALCSLASLAYEHPSWCWPTVEPMPHDSAKLTARALGHPLLAGDVCVPNDVEVGPPGSFLLVTGSNMSGKSTLLRAIGTNALLAQCGTVVCATTMRLPPLAVETSMRIQDSLEEGLSFFMAELHRLREIVQRAEQLADTPGPVLLYLLDEILQGTNSRERQIAVREVVGRLLASGAIGCVSTHDLALADAPTLRSAARLVHFREQIIERDGTRRMTFDYRLQPGAATTTNALELLRLVGL